MNKHGLFFDGAYTPFQEMEFEENKKKYQDIFQYGKCILSLSEVSDLKTDLLNYCSSLVSIDNNCSM